MNWLSGNSFRADPNDCIIVIMGPTGSGKSNFIRHITGKTEGTSAHNLKSDTQEVIPHVVSHHNPRLVLVDTPGFDDTNRSDSDILRTIANWLTKKYPDGRTLKASGVLYFHRITDKRMSGSTYKNLQMFGRLCGDVPLHRTRLITTMWDTARDRGAAQKRETELKSEFWKEFLDAGASTKRFDNTANSAREIVDEILVLGGSDELFLQEELVEQQKRLNETEAAKVLYNRAQKLLEEQKRTLKELADEARIQNDPNLARSLQQEYDKINAQLQKTFEDMRDLKISLPRRIILWLSRRKSRGQAVKLDNPN